VSRIMLTTFFKLQMMKTNPRNPILIGLE
jgi:hypothetical protein